MSYCKRSIRILSIYFKSAGAFKVYDASRISTDLTNHLQNDFRRCNQMYEVIPNNFSQKIIILCDKDVLSKMDVIRNYVVEYLESRDFKDISEDNVQMFENDSGMIEILVNGFYVSNFEEREKIVSGLMRHIEKTERNDEITSKMKRTEYSPFDGSQLIAMPNAKKLLDGKYFNFTDVLIRNLENCKSTSGNVYINIVQNISDNIVAGSITVQTGDSVNQFVDHIKADKPDWFKFGEVIPRKLLGEKYEEKYGKALVYKPLKGRLYSLETNTRNGRKREKMIKLLTLEKIK